jgi:predicted DNA-binding transcriptional regulator YafY
MARPDRLLTLVHLLAGPKRHRTEELAARLETTERTIYRDLVTIEELGFPVERVDGTYRLVDGSRSRVMPFTSRERLLLALALDNPPLKRHAALARDLRQLRTKLAGEIEGETPVARLGGPDRSGVIDPGVQAELESAIRERRSVSILYISLTDGKSTWRGIDPWALVHRSEAWYLVGRCHIHDEPRTFRLDRIDSVLPIGQSFEPPADFDLERWLEERWGIFEGDSMAESVIHFDPALAPLIERAQHHPSESKRRLIGGLLEYRVRVGNLEELARWVVGFAGRARAIEPQELVDAVRSIAAGATSAHPRKRAAAMVRRSRRTDRN